jgi:hypothetical protein
MNYYSIHFSNNAKRKRYLGGVALYSLSREREIHRRVLFSDDDDGGDRALE